MGIPNPYAIAAGLALTVAALGGSYVAGRMDGGRIEQAAQAKADTAAQKVRDELQSQIADSNQAHATKENGRQDAVREIDHEKETIVERPVYLERCVDADGLRLLQKAADNANGKGQREPSSASAGTASPAPNN